MVTLNLQHLQRLVLLLSGLMFVVILVMSFKINPLYGSSAKALDRKFSATTTHAYTEARITSSYVIYINESRDSTSLLTPKSKIGLAENKEERNATFRERKQLKKIPAGLNSSLGHNEINKTDEIHQIVIRNTIGKLNSSREGLSAAAAKLWLREVTLNSLSRGAFFRKPRKEIVNVLPPLKTKPKGICSGSANDSEFKIPFLLLMVLSSYRDNGVKERQAVRATYGSVAMGGRWPSGKSLIATVRLVFLLGTPPTEADRNQTEAEVREYGDLLIGDFIDSYRNLTLKVLVGLRWAADHCEQARYVMKADDDTFINLPLLLTFLVERGESNTIYGRVYASGRTFRRGRWSVSKKVYPLDSYPAYLSGTGYVIARDAVKSLLHASKHFPLIAVEDAYITGVLAVAGGVRRMATKGFTNMSERPAKACDFLLDSRIVGNRIWADKKYLFWKTLQTDDPHGCKRIK